MPNKLSQDSRRQLLDEYNVFHNRTSHLAPGYDLQFKNVVELSRRTEQQYTHDVCTDFHEKPWKQHNINRAKAITERVIRSLEQGRNESGWRSHVENWIFSRFEVEVVCPECRARLWRSELEAEVVDSQQSSDLLQERRAARKPCRCRRHLNGVERYDEGLNPLFEDRQEDRIVHEEEIMCKLEKENEKPDRVWGLRATERIERILSRQRPEGTGTVGDSITTSPFTGDASAVLYPFLLLETKSAKSVDTFSDIDIQIGFNVRTLLKLQYGLKSSLPVDQQASIQSSTLPLVWVVSSKGDHWRVSGAYICEGTSGIEYHILDLWNGRLTYTDQALRLVLILDYIFDWARDVFRGAIVDGLASLVQSPSNSLRSDTDVISTREFRKDLIDFDVAPEAETTGSQELETSDILRFYDKSGLALRDSSYMSHRVIGLYLKVETLDKFLCSVSKNDDEKFRLAESLFAIICTSECWSVTADCLNQLEKAWTDVDRESLQFGSFQQPFLACFSVKSYFGTGAVKFTSKTKYDDWVQVHTLHFTAIAADAFDVLRKMLGHSYLPDVPKFSAQEVIDVFDDIRHAPIRQCLAATIETRQMVSSCNPVGGRADDSENNHRAADAPSRRPILVQTLLMRHNPDGELPEQVYRKLKTGMREPEYDFLRLSKLEGKRTHENSGCVFWPGDSLKIGSCQLAVHVSCPQIKPRVGALDRVAHCIFLLPSPTHPRNVIESEPYDCTTSTHVLRMRAGATWFLNQPCIEELCFNSLNIALDILYRVTVCYFEHVQNRPRVSWQDLFRGSEYRSSERIPRLDFPPEEDQKYCLDMLRNAGTKFELEKKLRTIIETYRNAHQSYYSSSPPKPQSESMTSHGVRFCSCSPPNRRNNGVSSLPERPQLLSSSLSYEDEGVQSNGFGSYQSGSINLGSPATSESTESEMDEATLDDDDPTYHESSSEAEESMDSHEEDDLMREDYEVALQTDELMDSYIDDQSLSAEDESVDTIPAFEGLVAGLIPQALNLRWSGDTTVLRVSLPSLQNAIMAQDPMGQRYQLLPIVQDVVYTRVSPVPQMLPQSNTGTNQTPYLPPSALSGVGYHFNDPATSLHQP